MPNLLATRPIRQAALCSLVSVLCSLSLGCHSTPPPKPLDQLTAQEAAGHQAFQAHCAQCHHDRTADPLHGPGLLGVYKKPYLPSGAPANDDRVTATILHGRNLMPAQPDTDPQQVADLIAYLHTL